MIKITSPVFSNQELIPEKYTYKGSNINPPLLIDNILEKTKSLVLIIDDPDAPGKIWTHWLVWNINPKIKEINENSVPDGSIVGTNDSGTIKYDGPCPPFGIHRYFFKVYALDTIINLSPDSNKEELERVMKNHIIDTGELMGKYSK